MIKTHKIIGSRIIHLAKVDSTNKFAIELMGEDELQEGTVISTNNQTSGRGQKGRSWLSEAGKNIAMSIILYPKFLHPREQFKLSQVISLAIWDAIHDFIGTTVSIKWPNDIYIGKKKVCGILIQNAISSTEILSTVVGIGINVNQKEFVRELSNPTSIALEKDSIIDLEKFKAVLFVKMNQYYLQLKTRNFELIDKAYHQRLYQLNATAFYQDANRNTFTGKIIGTTPTGKLNIETAEGLRTFDLKEVSFL